MKRVHVMMPILSSGFIDSYSVDIGDLPAIKFLKEFYEEAAYDIKQPLYAIDPKKIAPEFYQIEDMANPINTKDIVCYGAIFINKDNDVKSIQILSMSLDGIDSQLDESDMPFVTEILFMVFEGLNDFEKRQVKKFFESMSVA